MAELEKVIRGLERCLNTGNFEECTENCPYFTKKLGMGVCSENMQRDALSLLKAQEPGWISVKDRLPDSGKHVLLCCEIRPSKKKYVCDGFYASKHSLSVHYVNDDIAYEYDEEADEYFLLEGWYEVIKNWEEYNSVVIDDFVTYWMPLPEPPKEET